MNYKKSKKRPPKKALRSKAAELTKTKERLLRVLMLLIPLLFFTLLELFLRLGGYGKQIPLFKTFEANPNYYKINPQLGKRYFPVTGFTPLVSLTDFFLKQKPPHYYRIFVLGGSSAAGYPYHYNASIAGILGTMLREYYPDKHLEVIDLAMPAVSSYAVRDIALELSAYDPDLLVIYAGHNEFYGGLGVGSAEKFAAPRWMVNLYLGLQSYRTFQLLREGLAAIRKTIADVENRPDSGEGGTLMSRLAKERYIPYRSELFFRAAETFRANISDVAAFCETNHIPLLIGTLVSNIRHHRPFVDVFASAESRQTWITNDRRARNFFARQQYRQALAAVEQGILLDSLPASQYYLEGRLYEALADTADAYGAFYRAKEFDGLRFRASEELNRRIVQFESRRGVTVVHVKEAFESRSPGQLPGKSLMLDHLHPNLEGYILMSRQFAEAILAAGYLGPARAANIPDSLWIRKVGVTDVDQSVADIRIRYLTMGWPFTDQPTIPQQDFSIENPTPIQELALRFWRDQLTWEKMHVQAAEYYQKNQQWEKAEQEYRVLIHATPANDSPYLFLGQLFVEQQKYDEALAVFLKAAQLNQNTYVNKMIGTIYLARRDVAGVPYLEKAVKLAPRDIQALFLLAQGYTMEQNFSGASRTIKQVLNLDANYPEARKLAAFITQQMNQQK